MPKTITIADDSVVLELDTNQLGLLDRALGGYAHALEAARDAGIISHETFCGKADRTRKVQYLVWAAQQQIEESNQQPQSPQGENPTADGGDVAAQG